MNRKSLIFLATGALAAAAITGTALASDTQEAPARTGSAAIAIVSPDPMSPAGDDATPSSADDGPALPTDGATSSTGATAGGAATAAGQTPVGPDRAGEIAVARIGGGTVVEVERELEHGRSVWSIKIMHDGVRHKVCVDTRTAQVVRVERDGADDHGRYDG